ncbi:MAG: hypothetical protein ISS70_13420 [Phycisphaerae bacterium]|nr:hypothetical protein [Phycisphaerae bacterium]
MERLPSDWKHTLAQCNMALAKRELAGFFQMANRAAEEQGQQAVFPAEFVHGWNEFFADPSYETAVDWFEKAPELAPMVFEYFQGSCPGGHLYRVGIPTAVSFRIGDYSLELPLASFGSLSELTTSEYQHFPRQFHGEAIYHASRTEFLGHSWSIMVAVVNGSPYKLAASVEIDDPRVAMQLIQGAFEACEAQLGTSTEEKQGLFIWDRTDGNVILQTASVMGSVAINIYATSAGVGRRPKS